MRSRLRQPYLWLGTGAATIGLGAAMLGSPAMAIADDSGTSSTTSAKNPKSGRPDRAADRRPARTKQVDHDERGQARRSRDEPREDEESRRAVADSSSSDEVSITEVSDDDSDVHVPAVAPEGAGAVEAVVVSDSRPQAVVLDPVAVTAQLRVAQDETPSTSSTHGDEPTIPVGSPLAWVVLAAARGQLGRSVEDHDDDMSLALNGMVTETTNTAPVATVSRQSKPSSLTGRVTGSIKTGDPDGDKVTYTGATTSKGTVTVTSRGSFTYTPTVAARHAAASTTATQEDMTDTVTVTVHDGNGGVVEVPITVAIRPLNSAPTRVKSTVAKADPVGGTATGRLTSLDRDGDTLTFTATPPKRGSVVIDTDGSFTYTPTEEARDQARASAFSRTDSFKVTLDDGHGGVRTITVRVNVAPTNIAPVAGTPTFGAPSTTTGSVKGTLAASDPDGDKITYSGSVRTASGRLTVTSSGRFTYTPTAAARHYAASGAPGSATDTVNVLAKDKFGAVTVIPVSVTIAPKNTAPSSPKVTVWEPYPDTGAVFVTVRATDRDGDDLTFSAPVSTPSGSVVSSGNGNFTYVPTPVARRLAAEPNAPATAKFDSFAIEITDGHGGVVSVPVTVVISPRPATAPAVDTTNPYGVVDVHKLSGVAKGWVNIFDEDGDVLTFWIQAGPEPALGSATIDSVSGLWTFTPELEARKTAWLLGDAEFATFTVAASDGTSTAFVEVSAPIHPAPIEGNIALGAAPWEFVMSPDGKRAYVTYYGDKRVAVVDTATKTVIDHISFDGDYALVVVSPDSSTVYVQSNLGPGTYLKVIDAESLTVLGDNRLLHSAGGLLPMLFSPDGSRIYSWNWSKLFVFDTATMTTIGGEPIVDLLNNTLVPGHVAQGFIDTVVLSADGSQLFIMGPFWDGMSGADGQFAVLSTATFATIVGSGASILTPNAANSPGRAERTVVSPDGTRIYSLTQTVVDDWWLTDYAVVTIDAQTNKVIGDPVPVDGVLKMVLSSDGKKLYVLTATGVTVIDTGPDAGVPAEIPLTDGVAYRPTDIALSADGRRLYLTRGGENADPVTRGLTGTITVIDTETGSAVGVPIEVPGGGMIRVSPDGKYLYALNFVDHEAGHGTITVIDTGTWNGEVAPAVLAPTSTAGLYTRLRDRTIGDDNGIYIEQVLGRDGITRLIVYIGGTELEIGTDNQPVPEFFDALNGDVDYGLLPALDAAVAANPGAPIMLVGYSQGGLDALNIADNAFDLGYSNIATVVTFATPIVHSPYTYYNLVYLIDEHDFIVNTFSDASDRTANENAATRTIFEFASGTQDVHGDRTTYEVGGTLFDQPTTGGFDRVKDDLDVFQGKVIRTWT